jgi:O-acetyl-ADP-ribose deacetylase (regulator of RNase III)
MIEYKTGDIFTVEAEAIVNTVNCVGVMGRGIALQFKKKYPHNFKVYAEACKHNEVKPGEMFVCETGKLITPRYIINFPTKRHWRGKSLIGDIEAGLTDLARVVKEKDIKSIALPPLGCGLGGLPWPEVKQRIDSLLAAELQGVQIIVYEPNGAPISERMVKTAVAPKMTPGRAALIELMHRYLGGLLDPFVTLLEAHKLMYFLQESGEELSLKYKQANYGPYAENLRHVFNAIEGHFISGYADGGDKPNKQLKLIPGAYENATEVLATNQTTQQHFKRVADLVDGFESPVGLELLSTVHWVAKNDVSLSKESVVDRVYAWSDRKKKFTSRQIEIALDVLQSKGWLGVCGQKKMM